MDDAEIEAEARANIAARQRAALVAAKEKQILDGEQKLLARKPGAARRLLIMLCVVMALLVIGYAAFN